MGTSAAADFCFCTSTATWMAAEATCRSTGLYLATIQNVTEDNAIAAVITATGQTGNNSSVWIGLNSIAGGWGNWVWADGTTSAYRDWLSGQPNNSPIDGPELCGSIQSTGGWNDINCGQLFAAICGR
jgi:hypothetical protein